MGRFSHVLLAADFDRTLTDANSNIPQSNLDAIRYFQEEGGAFTVATGRCIAMFQSQMEKIPPCAPLILCNGGLTYDRATGQIANVQGVPNGRQVVRELLEAYPYLNLEVNGIDAMYVFTENELRDKYYETLGAPYRHITVDEMPEPLIKAAFCGDFAEGLIGQFFDGTPEEAALFDRVLDELQEKYKDVMVVDRALMRIIDMQSVNSTKGKAARRLAKEMGRDVLVCAGDALNDLSMLEEADIAFIPSDALDEVKGRGFRETLPCTVGSIYGVIEELKKMYPEA